MVASVGWGLALKTPRSHALCHLRTCSTTRTTTVPYSATGQAETIVTYSQSGEGFDGQVIYSLDPATGRKARETVDLAYPGAGPVTTTYTYTDTGRLASAGIGGALTTYAYETGSGNIQGIKRGSELTSTLSYDSGNRELHHEGPRESRRRGERVPVLGGDLVGKVDPSGEQSLWAWFCSIPLNTLYRWYDPWIGITKTAFKALPYKRAYELMKTVRYLKGHWRARARAIWKVYVQNDSETLRLYLELQSLSSKHSAGWKNKFSNVPDDTRVWTIRHWAQEYKRWVVKEAGKLVVKGVSVAY